MRVMRRAVKKSENKPELKAKLDQVEDVWGVAPDKLHLHQIGPKQAAINEALVPFEQRVGNAMQRIYSEHSGTLINVSGLSA